MRAHLRTGRSEGFTLLELVIVLAVMAILAGVLIPIVKQILDSAKVAKVTSLIDALTNSCKRFYKDTRKFAVEDSNSAVQDGHLLFYNPNQNQTPPLPYPGWSGPYIETPLKLSALPFEAESVVLSPTLLGASGLGYYLAAVAGSDGPNTYSNSQGQEIVFKKIPAVWAAKINKAIDGENETTAEKHGRVTYTILAGGIEADVAVFVFDPLGAF